MQRLFAFVSSCLALLAAPALAEVRYVPVPFVGAGSIKIVTEYGRTDVSVKRVNVTRIPEGVAGATVQASREQVYIGPSTSTKFPLLDITPEAPGLIVLDAEAGLTSNEVSMELGKAPSNSGWELPLLSPANIFLSGTTAYVQNLTKTADFASNLSIFNFGTVTATCSVRVLRPKGSQLDSRSDLKVPAIGALRVDDILRRSAIGGGVVAAVTCDQSFYALGALPDTNRTRSRVYYPANAFPAAGTSTTLVDMPGLFLHVVEGNSFERVPIPLELAPGGNGNGPRYRSLTIDFDAKTADPTGFTVIRNITGLLRSGGRRFGKTLFFGNFDRLDAGGGPKMIVDLGTPYIETTVKRFLDLSGPHILHFHIELNADQKLLLYQIFNNNDAAIFNVSSGLFNDDLNAVGAAVPMLEFGLPGVADQAYFPPFGWRFSSLKVVGTR